MPRCSCNPASAQPESSHPGRSRAAGHHLSTNRAVRAVCSWTHLDAAFTQEAFQVWDGDRASVKDARGQGAVDIRRREHLLEVLHRAGTARSDERHLADRTHGFELRTVVAFAHTVAGHAVEHDLPSTTLLDFAYPI